jgi:hypothetical protein
MCYDLTCHSGRAEIGLSIGWGRRFSLRSPQRLRDQWKRSWSRDPQRTFDLLKVEGGIVSRETLLNQLTVTRS